MVVECRREQTTDCQSFSALRYTLGQMMNGLDLEEDDHFLVLKNRNKVIARWSATGVTVSEIQHAASSHIRNSCSNLELRLLRFWSRQPRAKLSLYTIASTLDTARMNLRQAIAALVEKGILNEQYGDDGLMTYALSSGWQMQEYTDELTENKREGEAVPA